MTIHIDINVGSLQIDTQPEDEPTTIIPTPPVGDDDPYDDDDDCSHENYSEVVTKKPTCEDDGEKTLTCDECGYQWTEVVDKLDHDYTVYVDENNHKCSRCGKLQYHEWKPIYDD